MSITCQVGEHISQSTTLWIRKESPEVGKNIKQLSVREKSENGGLNNNLGITFNNQMFKSFVKTSFET